MTAPGPQEAVEVPVVVCSACRRPYVLQLRFLTATEVWQYMHVRDCRCRRGMASATSRTATLWVLERTAAARAAQDLAPDELAPRRRRSDQ